MSVPRERLLGQPAGDQLGLAEALAAQVPGQRVPAAGGEAAAEVDRHLPVEAALGEELAGRRGLGGAQLLGVERRRRGVGRDQPGPLADVGPVGRAGRPAAVVLVVQLDVRPPGQQLDRLGEGEVVDLLDEGDDVAALAAAETVEEVPRRSDLERRRLLVVERAQPLEAAAAGPLELQVLADDLVDLAPLADQRDVRRPDASPPGHQPLTAAAPPASPPWPRVADEHQLHPEQEDLLRPAAGRRPPWSVQARRDQRPVVPLSASCRPSRVAVGALPHGRLRDLDRQAPRGRPARCPSTHEAALPRPVSRATSSGSPHAAAVQLTPRFVEYTHS